MAGRASCWQTAWDVASGASAALVVFVAVPAVLVELVGVPLPPHWTRAALVSWHGAFDVLAVVAWCAWAACAWSLLRSVAARVRSGDTAATAGARLGDRVAVRIAIGVLAVAPVVAASTPAGAVTTPRAAVAPFTPPAEVAAGAPATGSGGAAVAEPESGGQPVADHYLVSAGDSLWGIAEASYGDGAAWTAIAAANLGTVMDDGARFVDPSVIQPGWVLVVPPLDASGGAVPAVAPAAGGDGSVEAAQGRPVVLSGARPPGPVAADAAAHRRSTRRRSAPARAAGPSRPSIPPRPPSPSRVPVPGLVVVGCGVLVAGLIARRSLRARRLAFFLRECGAAFPPPSAGAADLSAALVGLETLPAVEWMELAVRHLGRALCGVSRPVPSAHVLRVAPRGVEVRFAAPPDWAPSGWLQDGASWVLPASSDLDDLRRTTAGHEPWWHLVVPLGEDDEGSWLLPLEAGSCVPVLGSAASAMVRAMRVAAESWTWGEQLVVTEDPDLAAAHCAAAETVDDDAWRARVLFVGDPGDLAPEVRRRCAAITTVPLSGCPRTVVVDEQALSLHPLGLTCQPALLQEAWQTPVEELLDGPASRPHTGTEAHFDASGPTLPLRIGHSSVTAGTTVRIDTPLPDSTGRAAAPPAPPVAGPSGTGTAVVRLLTAVPRIEGLHEDLPPKRARRAVELVAYLALHHPDPVTGDRLRTRVLGSADADAAAKTLFNTAGAARRSLGMGRDGAPLLPAASRSGRYAISPLVVVDALRLAELVRAGLVATEPEEAMALLREGLAQVEGEPLSGVLTGYGWWRAEGHERRLADLVVDGTCRLAGLAAAGGHLDLGRWALERARAVEPYSEALTRAAMELAAAAGDARRLHVEWQECQRQVDELDPGGVPSDATERLYARLRRHLSSGDPVAIGG